MRFLQLYVAAQGSRNASALWRETHKNAGTGSHAASRFLKRPDVQEFLARVREGASIAPIKEAKMEIIGHEEIVEQAARELKSFGIERELLISYWEGVLMVGANQILDDLDKPEPTLSHFVQAYKRRTFTDRDGNTTTTVEIRMPSKEKAADILAKLKNMVGEPSQTPEEVKAREEFAKSEWFQAWLERRAKALERQAGQERPAACP